MTVLRVTDGLLLVGDDLPLIAYAVQVAQRSRARNGLPPLARLEVLLRAVAARGHADIAEEPPGQAEAMVQELVTSQEAAILLGCSNRQARRLAPVLGGRLAGGRWLLDRMAVSEHIEGRTSE